MREGGRIIIWRLQKEKRDGKNIRGGKGSDIGKEGVRKEVEIKGMKLIKKSVMTVIQYE